MTWALVILGLWLTVAVVYRALSLRAIDARLADPGAGGEPVPPSGEVAVLRPLNGDHTWLESALESVWRAAAPSRTRVVLGVAESDDPSVPVIRRALARNVARPPTELRVSPGPPGMNRKMANLIQMSEGVPADILAFSDADVCVPEDYLDRAAGPFKDGEVGLVTFPYRSVPGRTLASRVDALITNTHFLPSVAMALEVQGLHFGLGASLVVRREALQRAGGLEALLSVCGDDYWMARNIEDAGYRLEFVPLMLDHMLEDEGWLMPWRRHLRWNRVVRQQRPIGYLGQITIYGGAPAFGLGALLAAAGFAAAGLIVPLAWWGFEAQGLWKRREVLGLSKRDMALIPLVGLAAFSTWLGGMIGRPRPS